MSKHDSTKAATLPIETNAGEAMLANTSTQDDIDSIIEEHITKNPEEGVVSLIDKASKAIAKSEQQNQPLTTIGATLSKAALLMQADLFFMATLRCTQQWQKNSTLSSIEATKFTAEIYVLRSKLHQRAIRGDIVISSEKYEQATPLVVRFMTLNQKDNPSDAEKEEVNQWAKKIIGLMVVSGKAHELWRGIARIDDPILLPKITDLLTQEQYRSVVQARLQITLEKKKKAADAIAHSEGNRSLERKQCRGPNS